jgi:uncharacterized protein (TIGR03546 family)
MIKPIAKLIIALNGNLRKDQIAAGFSWGLLLGLVPMGNSFIVWLALFLVSFLFKHHHASKILVLAILKIISGVIAPLVDTIGWELLHIEKFVPFFTALYNMPFVPLTRFNNTLVAGGLASGIILWLPVFLLIFFLIPLYRIKVVPKIRNSKITAVIKKLPVLGPIIEMVSKAALSGTGK